MARVHFVKKARKDNPVVKKGESYYWWKFRFGGKRYSKTKPERWQLTQSSFLSSLWQFEDQYEKDIDGIKSVEDIPEIRDNSVAELEMLRDECQDSLDNMPEHLQDTSDSGIQLTERIEYLDEWINGLEGLDIEPDSEEELEDWLENAKEEMLTLNPGIG